MSTTPEEQRIAIAEACGWKRLSKAVRIQKNYTGYANCFWSDPFGFPDEDCPNYLNDLNAMHEAEKVLQAKCKYWPDYIDELSKLFPFDFPKQDETNWSQMCHATAAQRAEAFLKAIGKWKQ